MLATISWLGSMLPTAGDRAGHAARRRDREDREREQHEAQEREALKNMTEAERRAWEAAHPKVRCPAESRPAWHSALTFTGVSAPHN